MIVSSRKFRQSGTVTNLMFYTNLCQQKGCKADLELEENFSNRSAFEKSMK